MYLFIACHSWALAEVLYEYNLDLLQDRATVNFYMLDLVASELLISLSLI